MLNNFNMRAFRDMQSLKIIGNGNAENNLESPCRIRETHAEVWHYFRFRDDIS
jgi:hypothetical protein